MNISFLTDTTAELDIQLQDPGRTLTSPIPSLENISVSPNRQSPSSQDGDLARWEGSKTGKRPLEDSQDIEHALFPGPPKRLRTTEFQFDFTGRVEFYEP